MMLLTAILQGCGGGSADEISEPARPEWRALLERARERARLDSARLSQSKFDAAATMALEFGRDEERVRIDDRFTLRKELGVVYRTTPLEHRVSGDSTLLKDMYTFRDSKGNPRAPEGAELAGLSFGSDFLGLLRALFAGEPAGYRLSDSGAAIEGRPCYLFDFTTGEKQGKFWIDRDSLALRRIETEEESDFVIGGYKYRLVTDFRPSAENLLLPVRTVSNFEYSRLASEGTGSILVVLDSVRVQ